MTRENGDLVREETMARVRQHVRAAAAAGAEPAELEAEVVETYRLNRVEAGLAQIMIGYYQARLDEAARGDDPRAEQTVADEGASEV
jgi:hypothetical protein